MDPAGPEPGETSEERASRDLMRLLTGGLTADGATFLIGAGAVLLMVLLYPVIGAWSLLAFPVVFVAAVVARAKLRGGRSG